MTDKEEPKTDIEWLKECVELLGLEIGKLTKRINELEKEVEELREYCSIPVSYTHLTLPTILLV